MTFDEIFAEYYPLYRGQATVPASTDREYLLAIPLANNAIRKWDRADGVLWRELYTTVQVEGDGSQVISIDQSSYEAPDNMRKPDGDIRLTDPTNASNVKRIPVVSPTDKYAKSDTRAYAYFVGGANAGWTLYFTGNITPYVGWLIDYAYYKKPTLITTGTDVPDMSDPNFIVQDMLASRFTASRNGFAYQAAKANATDALRNMIVENNSGSPGNSWNLLETDQTPGFGRNDNSSFFRS